MKKLLWGLVVLALLSSVSAFEVEITPDEQTVVIGGSAEYDLVVSHDSSVTEYFEIYSSDVQWDVSTIPSLDRILAVAPGKSKATRLVLRPLFPQTGLYVVDVTVKRSGSNEFIRSNLLIGVARASDEYSPAIFTKIEMPKTIDPREEVPIKIILKNQNKRYIQNLDVKIRSALINKDYTTSLKPLETKELDFKIKLDDATVPQEDALKISLFANVKNKTVRFDVPGVSFEVVGYGEADEHVEVEKGFLSTTRTVTLKNTGNAVQKKLFSLPSSFFGQLFTSSDHPYYSATTSDGRVLVWEVELGSAATETISITRNFRPVFLIIVLIIIGFAAYLVFRSPLVMKKAAMVIQTKEGGISELKVIVSVANRTSYPVRNLIIYDRVPKIAEVQSDFELGTMRPSKIIGGKEKGTLLKWNIDSLGPKEERILSYKIRTKLSILGNFRLPPTKIKFKFFNYERTGYSNVESLFGSQ